MSKKQRNSGPNSKEEYIPKVYERIPNKIEQYLAYYKLQLPHLLKNDGDMAVFRKFLEQPLPICFRLNPTVPNRELIRQQIDKFAASIRENQSVVSDGFEPISNIKWVISTVSGQLDLSDQFERPGPQKRPRC